MKNWLIAALVAVIAIGGTIAAIAAVHETTANVEVRVWQRVSDGALYLSTRPEAGTWTTHDAEALDMSELSRSGNFRQSSFVTVEVPIVVELPDPEPVEEATSETAPTSTPEPTAEETVTDYGAWVQEETHFYSPSKTYDDYRLVLFCSDEEVLLTYIRMLSRDSVQLEASVRYWFETLGEQENERWVGQEYEEYEGGGSRAFPLLKGMVPINTYNQFHRQFPTTFLDKLLLSEGEDVWMYVSGEIVVFDVSGVTAVTSELGCSPQE